MALGAGERERERVVPGRERESERERERVVAGKQKSSGRAGQVPVGHA